MIGMALLSSACEAERSGPDTPQPDAGVDRPARFSLEQLKDPETCKTCHPNHYNEWAGSMHAYASVDPVFLAMNKRGQRETNGALGDFCVNCHAPMAVREGLISKGGLDVEQAPPWAQGVTCYFCHNAIGLETPDQHFNGNVKLANDDVMRGSFNAKDPGVHAVENSAFHNRDKAESSILCGSCHDVKLDDGKGPHIERTFLEYKNSMFSYEKPATTDSCTGCHMPRIGDKDYIAVNTMLNESLLPPKRDHHEHRFPAVDVALTDFPDKEQQRIATECELHKSIRIVEMAVSPIGEIRIRLETLAGHAQPSGTAQDRRLWAEIIAYDDNGNVMLESGTIADGEIEELPDDTRPNRQQLEMFRDHMIGEGGKEVHMFWEAKDASVPNLLYPSQMRGDVIHYRDVNFRIPMQRRPARFVFRMRMRPMGMDVLRSLVDSGDLDPKFLKEVPTFTLNQTWVEWRKADGDFIDDEELRYVEPIPEICFERLETR
jgi:hypothetical protein